MADESVIVREELQILLNLLGERFTIKYPLYGFDIATLRRTAEGYEIRMECTRQDFEEASRAFDGYASEMPTYGDLVEVLLASGIITYRNIEAFAEQKKNIDSLRKNVRFSLDTNLFYHGFPFHAGIEAQRYVLVETVHEEIVRALNRKYSPRQISEMKRYARFGGDLLDELSNQKTKSARMATHIALREYLSIHDAAQIIPPIEPFADDREKNDLIIVRTLRKFEQEKYSLPLLLTADTNVAKLCEAEGLAHFLFDYPYEITVQDCSPKEGVWFLSFLAMTFGFLKCGPAIIFGEFGGKGGRDHDLKLRFLNPDLYREFERELDLCRRLIALGIKQ